MKNAMLSRDAASPTEFRNFEPRFPEKVVEGVLVNDASANSNKETSRSAPGKPKCANETHILLCAHRRHPAPYADRGRPKHVHPHHHRPGRHRWRLVQHG